MSAQSAQTQSEANGARKVAGYGIAVVHIATSQLQDGLEPLQYWQASEFDQLGDAPDQCVGPF